MRRTQQQIIRDDLGDITAAASDSFWLAIAAEVPEAKHGDFGPEETVRWDAAARDAVEAWVRNNVPAHPDLKVGDRVQFPSGICRHGCFDVAPGEYGVVKELEVESHGGLSFQIELERFHRDALEWENCVIFHWDEFGIDDLDEVIKTMLADHTIVRVEA